MVQFQVMTQFFVKTFSTTISRQWFLVFWTHTTCTGKYPMRNNSQMTKGTRQALPLLKQLHGCRGERMPTKFIKRRRISCPGSTKMIRRQLCTLTCWLTLRTIPPGKNAMDKSTSNGFSCQRHPSGFTLCSRRPVLSGWCSTQVTPMASFQPTDPSSGSRSLAGQRKATIIGGRLMAKCQVSIKSMMVLTSWLSKVWDTWHHSGPEHPCNRS